MKLMGYRQNLIKGLGWNGAFRIAAKAVVFGKIILAYRFLSPEQVGLYGLAMIALGLLEQLTETGVNVIIVKEKHPLTYYIDTAFLVSIARGILIALVLFGSSFVLPSFFRDEGLFVLLLWVSLIPLVRGFINPAVAQFQKDLRFELDALVRMVPIFADVVFSVVFVILWHSALAIILGMLTSAFIEVAVSFIFINPRPKIGFKKEVFWDIVNPGKWINVAGIMTYAEQNFDNVIVGRMLGATQLGYYQTAFNLTRSAIAEIGLTFSQVLLPIYGRIGEDKKRLIRAVKRVFLPAALIMLIPIILLNIPQMQELLLLFLKPKWRPMLPLLPFLSISAWFTGMNLLFNPLFLVTHRYKNMVLLYGSNLLLLILLLVTLIPMNGLVGAAKAVLIARLLLQPFYLISVRRALKPHKDYAA